MGVVSTLGVLEDGEGSSVSPSELPPALRSGRGRIFLSSHLYCGCRRQHIIVPPVSSPVQLWEPSAVISWQGDRLLQLASSRLGWSRREGWEWRYEECGGEGVVFELSHDTGCALMSVSQVLTVCS